MRPYPYALCALLLAALLLSGCTVPPEPVSNPAAHEPQARLNLAAVYAVGIDRVWVAGDGFIMASTDGGRTWQVQWTGTAHIRDLQFIDARTGWALSEQGLMATTDGEQWGFMGQHGLDSIRFLDALTGYGVHGEGLAMTEDGGRSWHTIQTPGGVDTACFSDPQTGWVADEHTLFRTQDGGATWDELSGPPTARYRGTPMTGQWIAVACPTSEVLWARAFFGKGAGTERWGVYRSADGGETWTLVAGPVAGNHVAAKSGPWAVVDAETVLLAGTGADYFTFEGTSDGGQTWEGWLYDAEEHTALPDDRSGHTPLFGWPEDVYFNDSQHGWVINGLPAADRWEMLHTVDGGRSWNAIPVTATTPIAEVPPETIAPSEAVAPSEATVPPVVLPPSPQLPTRDEWQAKVARELNEGGGTLEQRLNFLAGRAHRDDEVPWLTADLDGDGAHEYVLAREVEDGAALFVAYRQGDTWVVDASDPMHRRIESVLMEPHLHAAADLTGSGHPQIVWFRRELIATGPQPLFIFVTTWEPGRFSHIPTAMAVSNGRVALDGAEVVLAGTSRHNTYLPVMQRVDRYRYVDGAFRLVDRRFAERNEDGYARLWDGLVAEATGRVDDALTAYREAADPDRPAHSGSIRRYNTWPRELSADEVERFGEALRTFASFRLGVLQLAEGLPYDFLAGLESGNPYAGLLDAGNQSDSRTAVCESAQRWATANPAFLEALNLGVGTDPWTPDVLCGHIDIEDHGRWER